MPTYNLAEVQRFTSDLTARMNECDNGEGMECANFDGTLQNYARACCQFHDELRQWGRAVFYGRAAFDPEVESLWLQQGEELYQRADAMWSMGEELEGECFVLDSGAALGSALLRLNRLLSTWVTPKLASAPLARNGLALDPAEKEAMQRQIDALPPLPSDWQPGEAKQRRIFRKLRRGTKR